jgi:uncharacterized protein YecT (DUF1311 family)
MANTADEAPKKVETPVNKGDETPKQAEIPANTTIQPDKTPVQGAESSVDKPQTPESVKSIRELVNAQRAWLKYRDANCQLHAVLHVKDTPSTVNSLTCLERMTRERAEEIENLLKAQQ